MSKRDVSTVEDFVKVVDELFKKYGTDTIHPISVTVGIGPSDGPLAVSEIIRQCTTQGLNWDILDGWSDRCLVISSKASMNGEGEKNEPTPTLGECGQGRDTHIENEHFEDLPSEFIRGANLLLDDAKDFATSRWKTPRVNMETYFPLSIHKWFPKYLDLLIAKGLEEGIALLPEMYGSSSGSFYIFYTDDYRWAMHGKIQPVEVISRDPLVYKKDSWLIKEKRIEFKEGNDGVYIKRKDRSAQKTRGRLGSITDRQIEVFNLMKQHFLHSELGEHFLDKDWFRKHLRVSFVQRTQMQHAANALNTMVGVLNTRVVIEGFKVIGVSYIVNQKPTYRF